MTRTLRTCVPADPSAPPIRAGVAEVAVPTASSACCDRRSTFAPARPVAAPIPAEAQPSAPRHHPPSSTPRSGDQPQRLLQRMLSGAVRPHCPLVAAAVRLGCRDGRQWPRLQTQGKATGQRGTGCPQDRPVVGAGGGQWHEMDCRARHHAVFDDDENEDEFLDPSSLQSLCSLKYEQNEENT